MPNVFHLLVYDIRGNLLAKPKYNRRVDVHGFMNEPNVYRVEVWIGPENDEYLTPDWQLLEVKTKEDEVQDEAQPLEVKVKKDEVQVAKEKFIREYYGLSDREAKEILAQKQQNPSARLIGLFMLLGGGLLLLAFKRKQAISFTEQAIEKIVETGSSVKEKGDVANEIFTAANNNNIPARVLASIAWVESGWKTGAKAYNPEFYRNERDVKRFLEAADDITSKKPSVVNHPDWWQIKKIRDFHENNRDQDAMSFVKNWKDSGFSWGSHGPGQVLSFTARSLGYDPLGDNWTLGNNIALNLDLSAKELKHKYKSITEEGKTQNIVKKRVSELGLKWPENETERWMLVRAMYVCGTGLACGRDRIEDTIWPKFAAALDKFVEFA